MKIIALIAQKGGTGKTTLALALAVAAQRSKLSSCLIDLDPQATASKWGDRREDESPVIVSAQAARLPNFLKTAADNGADLVILDTPPRVEQAALAAAKVADLILIPCLPAINDLETLATTVELIRFAGQHQTLVVLNGIPPRGARREQAEHVIRDMSMEVCPVAIGYRTAFPDAAALGLTAQEYDPGSKAAGEIQQLYKFVSKLINSRKSKEVNSNAPEAGFAAGNA